MKKSVCLLISLVGLLSLLSSSIAASAAGADPGTTPGGVPLTELESFIDDFAADYIGISIPGAAVIVMQNDEILVNRSYGYANIESGLLVDDNTVFEWASVTKLLIWTSVMQLSEQGKLNLNADIRGYLPDGYLRKLKYDAPITMYNLMHHNAGWAIRVTDLNVFSPDDVISLGDAVKKFEPSQMFPPGVHSAYSNYGTAVAGYIVELISGQSFYDYVNQNIFAVLNMNETSIHPTYADNPSISERRNQTVGYGMTADGKLTPTTTAHAYLSLYPAGSGLGTASDMAKFLSALIPAKGESSPLFRHDDTLKQMLSLSYSFGEGIPGVAHGFHEEFFAVNTLMHSGSNPPFVGRFMLSPDTGLGLIVLANIDMHDFGNALALALYGEPMADEFTGTLPDIRNLPNLAGQYEGVMRAEDRGFMKFLNAFPLPANAITIVDENTFHFQDMEFKQISPHVFIENSGVFTMHIIIKNNEVSRVLLSTRTAAVMSAGAVVEFVPVADTIVLGVYLGILLLIVIVAYLALAVLLMVGGGIRNRIKAIPSSAVKKINLALNLSAIAVFLNYVLLIVRMGMGTSYKGLVPHFVFNVLYMVFVPAAGVFIFMNMKKAEISKGSKVFCVMSCIVSVVFAVFMYVWEFYR